MTVRDTVARWNVGLSNAESKAMNEMQRADNIPYSLQFDKTKSGHLAQAEVSPLCATSYNTLLGAAF